MRAVVIGGTETGTNTAAYLAKRGHEVFVLPEGGANEGWKAVPSEFLADTCCFWFICTEVGVDMHGNVDLKALHEGFDKVVSTTNGCTALVVRTTIPMGTMQLLSQRTLCTVLYWPAFSSTLSGYYTDNMVVGCSQYAQQNGVLGAFLKLVGREGLDVFVSYEAAELAKYATGVWAATQVALRNEIASVAFHYGVNGNVVAGIAWEQLINTKEFGDLPFGMPFGGPELSKDLRAIVRHSRTKPLPLISSVLMSNVAHLMRMVVWVSSTKAKRIGIYGVRSVVGSLRESPSLAMATMLAAADHEVWIYDPLMAVQTQEKNVRVLTDLEELKTCDLVVSAFMDELSDAFKACVTHIDLTKIPLRVVQATEVPLIWTGR